MASPPLSKPPAISGAKFGAASPSQSSLLPAGYDWLRSQSWDPDRYTVGTSPYRPSSIRGGLSATQFQGMAAWEQNATIPDPPRLTTSILNGKAKRQPKVGQFALDFIDPFTSMGDASGSFFGQETPLIGNSGTFDPLAFLASKNIDFINTPSRLGDYVAGPLIASIEMLSGARMPNRDPKDTFYPFQADPAYWSAVANASEEDLRVLAFVVINKYADAASNQYLVEQLLDQFRIDRAKTTYRSSGNVRTDYLAKSIIQGGIGEGTSKADMDRRMQLIQLQNDAGLPWAATQHLSMGKIAAEYLPFVGTEAANLLRPVSPEAEAYWESMTPDQRQTVFKMTSTPAMLTEMAGGLVLFSGVGVVAAVAKGAGGVAGAAYKTYSGLLTASKALMAGGVVAATVNWGLAAAWDEDVNLGPITGKGVKEFTTRVDLARPFSDSQFAGIINGLGIFSSGTYGAVTAIKGGYRLGKAIGSRTPVLKTITSGVLGGFPDTRLIAFGFGGSDMTRLMTGQLGLSAKGIRTSYERFTQSRWLNGERTTRFNRWQARLLGHKTNTFLDDLPDDQVVELASQDMARGLEPGLAGVEAMARTINEARKAPSLLSDDAARATNLAARNFRSFDDGLARDFVNEYGAPFIQRLTGGSSPVEIRAWLEKAVARLGGTPEGLPAANTHTLEWWHQLTRAVYHVEFDHWAGVIHAAGEGSEELARISIMSRRHLFRDEATDSLAILKGDDEVAALEEMKRLLGDKVEVEQWHASEIGRNRGSGWDAPYSWTPTPKQLAEHIEDIYETLSTRRRLPDPASTTSGEPLNFQHAKMEAEGLWTIGFKPVNEAGDFVASVQTRSGQIVQAKWLDYPLSNVDNIEVGNRGVMSNKMDAVTRGFRTWRIMEYQRGALFRSLSSKTNLSATQLAAFHDEVLRLARKRNLSPQAVGRMPDYAPGIGGLDMEVEHIARKTFGEWNVSDLDGNPIDLRREIGNAYRTAYRLNLTAGLTSHLKASFGPVGELVTFLSDSVYVMWRFGASPLFKGGEIWESAQLNLMRRVMPGSDPYVSTLYLRQGAGSDPAAIATEVIGDQFAQGLLSAQRDAGLRSATSASAEARSAASLGWYARQAPEDHAQNMVRLAMREQAAAFRAKALGGEAIYTTARGRVYAELANSVDDAGKLVPGADEARVRVLLRTLAREDLDPAVAAALDAHPWGAPTARQLAEADDLTRTAAALRALEAPEPFVDSIQVPGHDPNLTKSAAYHEDETQYLFHAVNHEDPAFDAIRTTGIQSDSNFVVGQPSGYGTIQLRVRSDHPAFAGLDPAMLRTPGRIAHGKRTTGQGQDIGPIRPEDVEFFGKDGRWHSFSPTATADRIYYRGTTPGSTARIQTGDAFWDSHLFVTESRKYAGDYGPDIETVLLADDARVLREGTKEFAALEKAALGARNSLERSSRIAQQAEKDGWDAVHFARQGDVGTIILNESKVIRNAGEVAVAQSLDDAARLVVYRDLIARGIIEPDARLALRDRYDELIETLVMERAKNRAFRRGGPIIPAGPGAGDLTDPITGLPVVRDILYASEREFDSALRSLRSRKGKIKVNVPAVDDLAHRLEIAAEAAVAPRPILRNERVGPIDAIPEGYTLDPVGVYLDGDTNLTLVPNRAGAYAGHGGSVFDANGNPLVGADARPGVAPWIDLSIHDPATAGMWHATVSMDAVLDTGLKARSRLIIESVPDDFKVALKEASKTHRATEIRVFYKDATPPTKLRADDVNALIDGTSGTFYDDNLGRKMDLSEVLMLRSGRDDSVIWKPSRPIARAPEGLSASVPDRQVSLTTNFVNAQATVARHKIMSGAARAEIPPSDIIDHFLDPYLALGQRGLDEGTLTLAPLITPRANAIDFMATQLSMSAGSRVPPNLSSEIGAAAKYEKLVKWMDRTVATYPDPGDLLWRWATALDTGLSQYKYAVGLSARRDIPSGSLVFAGGRKGAAAIDPAQVGMVRVAVRDHQFAVVPEVEARSALDLAYSSTQPGDVIAFSKKDGGRASFIRWWPQNTWLPDGSLVQSFDNVHGMNEAQHFKVWVDDLFNDARADPELGPSGISMTTRAGDESQLAGKPPAPWEDRPKGAGDDFEIKANGEDIYVIDDRVNGEPLATDDEGLLRQLRQVIDEDGGVLPGYQKRHDQLVHELEIRKQAALNPDPVTTMADIPETAEGITANLESLMKERWGDKVARWNRDFWDPVPGKERRETQLAIQMQREEFPLVIRGTPAEKVFRGLDIPEQEWADFLVVDRDLLSTWQRTRDPDDLAALIGHAGTDTNRASMDALYASEEWEVVASLWSLNQKAAGEEAFGVHFFDQYRSPLLRSINHPLLGVYPASWALKTGREWVKFLFDNRMFGVDLRMGMTPAVAISNITRAQQVAFAQQNAGFDGTMDDYMQDGPLGSSIFVFNLLMPGDWSAIPFPLSRSIREILRGNYSPGDILAANVTYMGVTRDIRLMSEMAGEFKDLVLPPEPEPRLPRDRKTSPDPRTKTPTWQDIPTR